MTEATIGYHLDKLKPVERNLLMFALNHNNTLGYQIHLGMLPFVKVESALMALTSYDGIACAMKGKRIARQLKMKLGSGPASSAVNFVMYLNDKKIAKRFGAHPERGHKIPFVGKKRVTCGVRWSLPKRDFEPDRDVLVQPHVVLVKLYNGQWRVTCEGKHRQAVERFLCDYCM